MTFIECEKYMGCLQASGAINYQNNEECTECGGTYQPIFTWTPVSVLYN